MIASIRGILKARLADTCVIEAGGIGYELHLSQPALLALPALGEAVEFSTYFHVREDAQQLYGFATADEKQLFLMLTTVKGVGPKLALSILSQLGPAALLGALKKRDLGRLASPAGVGKKLAERLAVELSDKASKLVAGTNAPGPAQAFEPENSLADQATRALLALGYSSQQAKTAVARAYQQLGSDENRVEDIVKMALKFF